MVNTRSKTQQRNLSTFLNMPLHVANQVLEKMEPMDLLSARKVCRSLRTAVDKVGLHFDYTNLALRKDKVEMNLNGTKVRYTKAANGNLNVIHNRRKKKINGETCVARAVKDFKIIMKHAREIILRNDTENGRDIITTFIEILKSEKCIHVEEIELRNFSFDEVLTILPCFNAKKLNKIELDCIVSINRFKRITHLEQWENAEKFIIYSPRIASTMIVHLFHFKFFRINCMGKLSVQTVIQIRDDLLRRSTFQSCEIQFENPKIRPIEIAKVFKPDYAGGNKFEIEFSNDNDEFNIDYRQLPVHRKIYFLLEVKRLLKPLSV